MRRLYLAFGLFILLGYSYMAWRGVEIRLPRRAYSPQGLRSAAHGGYRSFWFGGFHGGK
ncbi:MAG TPA: hypothetical protein VER58_12990 [Thermoanaerobaculia bacterium]|nr:hypothetical protein [Thermoanaerobaculia bacterium]